MADTALAGAVHPQIQQFIEAHVAQRNAQLASYETIKKFIIAPTDFTPESGELTPTLKVKRKVVTNDIRHNSMALRGRGGGRGRKRGRGGALSKGGEAEGRSSAGEG